MNSARRPRPTLARSRGGELLRGYRRVRGLSQAELGARLGPDGRPWSAELVCAWERGTVQPRPARRRRIARLTRGCVPVDSWDQAPEAVVEQLCLFGGGARMRGEGIGTRVAAGAAEVVA